MGILKLVKNKSSPAKLGPFWVLGGLFFLDMAQSSQFEILNISRRFAVVLLFFASREIYEEFEILGTLFCRIRSC